MIRPGIFEHASPFKKLIIISLLAFLCLFVFMTLGSLFALLAVEDFFTLVARQNNLEDIRVVNVLRYIQIISQVGLFVVPPVLFAWLDRGNIITYFSLHKNPGYLVFVLSSMMVFVALPFIHWSAEINEAVRFPEWLSGLEKWMHNSEENARLITEAFLDAPTLKTLMLNMIMIAVLPAIGEELLFRGVVQRLLNEWTKNVHVAIILTAILFSALHLQFYGFLPRTILGVIFGYMFVITKTIWVPVLMHFLNNAAAVIAAYLFRNDLLKTDYQDVGQVSNPLWIAGSLVMLLMLISAVFRMMKTRNELL
jgi:uncharacterized protein